MKSQKKRHGKRVRLGRRADKPIYWCRLHRRSLSRRQAKLKHCEEKNCCHLLPYRPTFKALYSDEVPLNFKIMEDGLDADKVGLARDWQWNTTKT